MKSIAAFDVFDTVLTRAVGAPQSVFLLLGRRLSQRGLIDCTPEVFARARRAAELRAYNNLTGAKVTLADIYRELAAALGLPAKLRDQIQELECQVESELLRVLPGAPACIAAARQEGKRIIFISDMYLPGDFIREQLTKHGLAEPADGCYVSCEYGKLKRDGHLFREILAAEGVKPREVCHHGNDHAADIQPAQKLGFMTRHLANGNQNRYEAILEKHAWSTQGLASVMAGASRLARHEVAVRNEHEATIRDFTAGMVGPMLVGFVLWVLRSAQEQQLNRLYFLARDAEVCWEIAKRLAPRLAIDCELRYLYSSRRSWGMPSVLTGSPDELTWATLEHFANLGTLLARMDLTPGEARACAPAMGWTEAQLSEPLSAEAQAKLRTNGYWEPLRPLLLKHAASRRKILLQYLEQEGVLRDARFALVDVGWNGTLQDCLGRVLQTASREPALGLYFGLKTYRTGPGYGPKRAYYMNLQQSVGVTKRVFALLYLLESMSSGTEGTVLHFAANGSDGRVRPVLKTPTNQPALEWGLPVLRQTIEKFVDHLTLDPSLVAVQADVQPAITELFNTFWLTPTVTEAQVIGSFPFESGLGTAEDRDWMLTREYNWHHIGAALLQGNVPCQDTIRWPEGSLAQTRRHRRLAFRLALKTGKMLHNPQIYGRALLDKAKRKLHRHS